MKQIHGFIGFFIFLACGFANLASGNSIELEKNQKKVSIEKVVEAYDELLNLVFEEFSPQQILEMVQSLIRSQRYFDLRFEQTHAKNSLDQGLIKLENFLKSSLTEPELLLLATQIKATLLTRIQNLQNEGQLRSSTASACEELSTGQVFRNIKAHTYEIISQEFSPNSKRVLTSSRDQTVKIWDIVTGRELAHVKVQGFQNESGFSPDSQSVLTLNGKTALLWNASTGAVILKIDGGAHSFSSFSFSSDGRWIVTSGFALQIWDASTGAQVSEFFLKNSTKTSKFSPDGSWIASMGYSSKQVDLLHTTRAWQGSSSEAVALDHPHTVQSAFFSPDGKWLATLTSGNQIYIWEVSTGRPKHTLNMNCFMSDNYAEFSSDSKLMMGLCPKQNTGGQVFIWDVTTGTQQVTLTGDLVSPGGHTVRNSFISAQFSPDFKLILTCSTDGQLRLWDIQSRVCRETILLQDLFCTSAQFSPDGKTLLATTQRDSIGIWDFQAYMDLQSSQKKGNGKP